jgi:cyclopropane fatty-acyl-phospholipid synthase-like methyltransferase
MFKEVLRQLQLKPVKRILEVGCGTGAFAHFLLDKSDVNYYGFDFSQVAVDKARSRTTRNEIFGLGDATREDAYSRIEYDALVCTEVLEHIESDLIAIELWRAGTYCICSVPNYDADTHVRYFKNSDEVRSRYGDLLNIHDVVKRCKPMLNDLTIGNWLNALRWNRYRPDRLKWLFGFSDFDRNGGWFIFNATRR